MSKTAQIAKSLALWVLMSRIRLFRSSASDMKEVLSKAVVYSGKSDYSYRLEFLTEMSVGDADI